MLRQQRLLTLAFFAATARGQAQCNHRKMDLTLVLDSSGSVRTNWDKIVDYADHLVAGMSVGLQSSRVAIIHYNDKPYTVQHYNQYVTNQQISANLRSLRTATTAAQGEWAHAQTHAIVIGVPTHDNRHACVWLLEMRGSTWTGARWRNVVCGAWPAFPTAAKVAGTSAQHQAVLHC